MRPALLVGHGAAALLPLSGCQVQLGTFSSNNSIKKSASKFQQTLKRKIQKEKFGRVIHRNKNVGTQLTSDKLHGQLYSSLGWVIALIIVALSQELTNFFPPMKSHVNCALTAVHFPRQNDQWWSSKDDHFGHLSEKKNIKVWIF